MNIKHTYKKYKNEKGQTLLFVIVAVTIAMAVGVSVSTRTIQSLKRVARTDTSARVIAAAEGGIENLLSRSYSQLNASISGGVVGCEAIGATTGPGGTCVYVFDANATSGDAISSKASVKVETFNSNDVSNGLSFSLTPGSLKEVNLNTYTRSDIKICWSNPQSVIYYSSYDSGGVVRKGGIKPSSGSPSYIDVSNLFVNSGGTSVETGYSFCKEVDLVGSSYGLRIKVLYNEDKVAVFPTGGVTLPDQGYKFTSIGEILTGSDEKATVIVHKSLPYAPDIFDYGIYTPEGLSESPL